MSDLDGGPEGPTTVKSSLGRFASIAMSIAVAPLMLFAFAFAPSCMGFGPPALAAVNECPAAVALLGGPITQPWVGLSCGNAETEDDDGRASWSMPVVGPRGRGTLDLQAAERGGRWQFGVLTLSAGGRTIDVLGCAAGGSGEAVAITHRVLSGVVTTIVGEPGVTSGAACTITIDPSEGAQSCQLAVACGERTLYGGGTQGYGHCASDASGALTMRDGNPSTVDGDPMLDLGAGQVVVTDQGSSGIWVVTITTSP